VKEMVRLSGEAARSAHYIFAAIFAETGRHAVLAGDGLVVHVKFHIARHEEIEPAVVVVVAPGRSCGPARRP
jgi:hypothetical protein